MFQVLTSHVAKLQSEVAPEGRNRMTLPMSWDEWAQHDGTALAARVRKGEVMPTELAAQAAAGVAKVDPILSGVVEMFEDVIADPAKDGANLEGRFAGLPFLMKDLGPTMKGRLQEMGSLYMRGNRADGDTFLTSWEFMSIASYLLVNYEHEREESSHAGFVMLAMSEAGTIAIVIAFFLASDSAGSLQFNQIRSGGQLGLGIGWTAFLLSFFGFAVKAGLAPVNSWLPLAHPVAPTNVSALLSAVIVNLGIYGIVRFNLDLRPVAGNGPGLIVLVLGSVSALIGILYATVQAELKRLLAHSTIENMGIIAAGIGAAMVFQTSGHSVIAGIALIAALYHLINHSVYKALLFLGTGSVEAATGTRDLDGLGVLLG
jgi:hypothetical protein